MNQGIRDEFLEAVLSREPVEGLTHNFYRYPARFSPQFARAAIKAFTKPGDVVLDPFMGGGTTLVEARVLGRRGIGADINSLAVFVSKVKTTLLSETDLSQVRLWGDVLALADCLSLHNPSAQASEWTELGYQRNINGKSTWPIRKTLELALAQMSILPRGRQRRFARCILLKTAQWALDCRKEIPSAKRFRQQFFRYMGEMIEGAKDYANVTKKADCLYDLRSLFRTLCLHRSAVGIETDERLINIPAPALILTSPPYPGVHALYHRWQVQGRKETPAPFWIADSLDGNGEAFYTFGDHKRHTDYYNRVYTAFASLARIADHKTWLVQMVAFSEPSWQLLKYLSVMEKAGFVEVRFPAFANSLDGRLWRCVPNRKWYADQRGAIATSKEVVFFHHLS